MKHSAIVVVAEGTREAEVLAKFEALPPRRTWRLPSTNHHHHFTLTCVKHDKLAAGHCKAMFIFILKFSSILRPYRTSDSHQ